MISYAIFLVMASHMLIFGEKPRSDALKKAFKDDLNSHMTALEAVQYTLNEKILQGVTEAEVLVPIITDATQAIEKFGAASKHIKKFIAPRPMLFYPRPIKNDKVFTHPRSLHPRAAQRPKPRQKPELRCWWTAGWPGEPGPEFWNGRFSFFL